MNPIHLCKPWCGSAVLLIALAATCWLCPGEAVPQEQRKERKAPVPAPAPEMQVFQAKFVKAQELGPVISQALAPHVRVSVDERSNSVIVVANAEDMATVKDLIQKIDVPKTTRDARVLTFYHLRNIKADSDLDKALQRFLPRDSFFLDPKTNQVIISADKNTQQAAMTLIERLDVTKAPDQEVQVRVIWLASGLDKKVGRKPPEDMKEVVAELAKMGVEESRLVAQTLVSTLPGNQFRTEGLAELDQTYRLAVSGSVAGNHQLQISIAASPAGLPRGQGAQFGGGPSAPIARLDTEITAPPGHSVVLGMTPTPNSTSVFVVQILPKK